MKIWTTLPASLIRSATPQGVTLARIETGRGRDGRNRYDVILSGSASHHTNNNLNVKAATWDEWGLFLARLFDLDPHAKTSVYESAEHFEWSTMGRYDGGVVHGDRCRKHKWEHAGWSAGDAYAVHYCTRCDAERRFLAYGRKFSNLSLA